MHGRLQGSLADLGALSLLEPPPPREEGVSMAASRVVMHQIVMPSEVDALGICFGGQAGFFLCPHFNPIICCPARSPRSASVLAARLVSKGFNYPRTLIACLRSASDVLMFSP